MVHYPFMYLFYYWMMQSGRTAWANTQLVSVGVVLGNVLLAWILLKCYDEPVRRALTRKFLSRRA